VDQNFLMDFNSS
jgi:hypothetical protein